MKKFLEKKIKVGKKGFTLVELIVVIVIIAILAAIAIPAVSKYIADSKNSRDKANARMMRSVGNSAGGAKKAGLTTSTFAEEFVSLMGTDDGNIVVSSTGNDTATAKIGNITYTVSYTDGATSSAPFSITVTSSGN